MRVICLLAVALVTGCASGGTQVSAEQIAAFTPGTTTEADVIASLGNPNNSITRATGVKVDMYVYTEAHATAASYVPVVGVFAGGAVSHNTTATFTFDHDGVLTSVASSKGQTTVNTGLLNQ